jgi:hypothetical protein
MIEGMEVTPHGIPVIAYPSALLMLGVAVWDSLSVPENRWFRWLTPIGILVIVFGIFIGGIWPICLGAVIFGTGLGLNKWQRSNIY